MRKLLPETVKVNGKIMPIYDFMLQRCESKNALHKWIKLFLGLDMPDCIVCEESTASPMDMIWNVYDAAASGDPEMASQLYFASRDSFKTLSAAIIEVLMLTHFRRTASHMGAIIQQSKKCYDYFQKFFRRPVLDRITKEKDTMERTELVLDSPWDMNPYLQIVRCTMAGANSEHTHFMCVDGNTQVRLKNGFLRRIADIKEGNVVITINPETGLFENKPVLKKWKTGLKEAFEVTYSDGGKIIASADHDFYIVGRGFVPLKEIHINDFGVVRHRNSNARYKKKSISILEKSLHNDAVKVNHFEQVVLGSMLGDGGVYKKLSNNAYYKEQHCREQKEYLNWKRSIIGAHCNTRDIHVKSGFTGEEQVGFASGCNSIFNKYTHFKETLEGLDVLDSLGLAVWYMDDGCAGRGLRISSESFTQKQNEQLVNFLNKKFGFSLKVAKYIRKSKAYFYIKGSRADKYKLYYLCRTYIHPSMIYKFTDYSPYTKNCKFCNSLFSPAHSLHRYCSNSICQAVRNGRLRKQKIINIRSVGSQEMYDITIKDNHNFFANKQAIWLGQCTDEVDVVQNVQAYREAKKIPTETPDKKPSITMYISTRKSAFGLVQQEVDNAVETGLKVFSWNIIDVTQACPKSKNRMDEGNVNLYLKQDELELIPEKEHRQLTEIQKADYIKKEMYPGCVGCKIAPLCLGRLATRQKSNSHLLKSHNDVAKKFRESTIEDAVAQLMCLKPSTHGIVFTQFSELKSVMSSTQMWELFMGEKAVREISKDELIETFQKYQLPAFAGIDWGWDSPSVCLVMYIDKKHNIYVVHELSMRHTDQPEFIDVIKRKVHPKYKVQMYYPDTADPSSVNLLKKADLPVSSKVDKHIHPGIQTMKKYVKVPGLGITKFFVLGDGSCKGLLDEFKKYHLLLDAAGQIIAYDTYAEEFDHRIDAARYVIHSRLGRFTAQIAMGETPKQGAPPVVNQQGNFTRTPSATELARHLGRDDFKDNREDVDNPKDPKTGGDAGGFSWSFGFLLGFGFTHAIMSLCGFGLIEKIIS